MTNKKDLIIEIVNIFENDSGSPNTEFDRLYLYHDGPNNILQVTLARGYTEDGGSLWKVFEIYKSKNGKNADKLLSYKKDSSKGILGKNKEFLNLIVDSARNEQSFKDSENETFDLLYWNPAFDYFNNFGFKEQLSLAVIEDSKLHSGGILKFLTNKFSEKKPSDGGNEKVWIKSYLTARLNWLSNASELLQHTIYRPNFFLNQIKNDNWDLEKMPIIVNGVKLNN